MRIRRLLPVIESSLVSGRSRCQKTPVRQGRGRLQLVKKDCFEAVVDFQDVAGLHRHYEWKAA